MNVQKQVTGTTCLREVYSVVFLVNISIQWQQWKDTQDTQK
jgi:hypothetical protein